MATALQNLITRRDAICEELADGATPDGQSLRQPSISVDGESIPTDQYVDRLYRELKSVNDLIDSLGGGFEIISRGVP